MDYPLNMRKGVGYAVANDEAEHQALSDAGYEPKLESVDLLRAKLDAKGISYDKRLGVEKLKALLV